MRPGRLLRPPAGRPRSRRDRLQRPLPGRPLVRPIGYRITAISEAGDGPPPRPTPTTAASPPTTALDLTLKRQTQKDPIMPITILDYVKSVVGDKDLYTAEDCLANGVDILGGCQGCHATIAATTPTPPPPGTGAAPTASARRLRHRRRLHRPVPVTPARPAATPTTSARPASPPASAPRNTRWNAGTAARSGSHDHRPPCNGSARNSSPPCAGTSGTYAPGPWMSTGTARPSSGR